MSTCFLCQDRVTTCEVETETYGYRPLCAECASCYTPPEIIVQALNGDYINLDTGDILLKRWHLGIAEEVAS